MASQERQDHHLASLRHYAGNIFDPYPEWLASDDARIQSMVGELPTFGAKKVHEFAEFRDDSPNRTN